MPIWRGPFLCMAKKGAQNGDYLHNPDAAMLKRLQEASEGCVKLVTLAPEQPGSIQFIKAAAEMGIHVSVGHTTADYNTARSAFEAGADHATHLFNAMPPSPTGTPASLARPSTSPTFSRSSSATASTSTPAPSGPPFSSSARSG